MSASVIDASQAGFMLGPVSILLATSSAGGAPALAVGLGLRIGEDRRQLTVFALDTTSAQIIADVRAGRPIAVAFTHPATARGIQVKAPRGRLVPAGPDAGALLDAYADALAREWARQGQPVSFGHALLARTGGELVAIELEPTVAFEQSPGPNAGAVLAERR